jgi:hypothetical protein
MNVRKRRRTCPCNLHARCPIRAAPDLVGPARPAYDVASGPYGQPRDDSPPQPPSRQTDSRAFNVRGFTVRRSAVTGKPTTARCQIVIFSANCNFRDLRVPSLSYSYAHSGDPIANEVNLTQIYSPGILAHCVTEYHCRSRWGSLLPQSDPQPCRLSAFQPIRSVETSLRQHGRSDRAT